jgi:NAD(P)-dependent dehydrogenase (short-subunit alcohol dehydrogenase family)
MKKQRVVITAGASGIGLEMARAFAAVGAQVWVLDNDPAALSMCPQDWQRDLTDVADETSVGAAFGRIGKDWGGLDVLCCNAGIAGPTALIEDIDLSDWHRCLAVNLDGAFLAARAAAPMMKSAKSGVILFTSSTAGQYGYPGRAPYVASKWALHGLMKTVAVELGPFGVRANVICPGSVEGPRIERVLQQEAALKGTTRDVIYEGYASGTSMRCLIEAQDVAQMAVFLASDAARRVSGQIIAVDGHTENPIPRS